MILLLSSHIRARSLSRRHSGSGSQEINRFNLGLHVGSMFLAQKCPFLCRFEWLC